MAQSKNKKTASKSKKNVKKEAELEIKKKNEIVAIVLLVAGIITFLIAVIKGESGWFAVHNFVYGFVGFCSFIIPILLIFLAYVLSQDKFSKSIIPKCILVALLVVFLSSAIYLFKSFGGGVLREYGTIISDEYLYYDPLGGGVLGALFGFPLGILLGPTGAKIVTVIATLTTLMILTGTTVSQLFTPAKKIKEKTAENYVEFKQRREERREEYIPVSTGDIYDQPEPDLNIYDPEPDVLTGSKTKRKGTKTKVKLKESAKPKTEEKIDVDDFDSKINEIFKTKKEREEEQLAAEQELEDKEQEKKEKLASKRKAAKAEKEIEEELEKADGEFADYILPPTNLLKATKKAKSSESRYELEENAQILIETLENFGVDAEIVDITRGPTVTRYDIKPAVGVRISKITNLSADIALSLATTNIRIAPIPNKAAIGIEVPNRSKNVVGLRPILESPKFEASKKNKLTVALGENIAGEPQYANLAKMPHLLIAGTTGSGKSVCLNSMIISILFNATPDEVKFIMIDPKGVELSVYNGIPHMPIPVVKDPHKAAGALQWAVKEMLHRYGLFEEFKVRDLKSYNKIAAKNTDMEVLPQMVIVIDELADLMMVSPGEVEDSICRLAQMARAAGMHLVIATQSPRADVITGLIKANIPSRIALSVSNGLDSRIILDQNGAEKLLGHGDMLFNPVGASKPMRIQGCYVGDDEIESVIKFIKKQCDAEYSSEIDKQISELATKDKTKKNADLEPQGEGKDELIDKAIEVILENNNASTSFLQRKLGVGYARGARLIDELEEMGIIGEANGSKGRKILITKAQWIERNAMTEDDQMKISDDGTVESE